MAKKRRLSPKQGRLDDWARVISHIPIIPALFHHNFGGDAQGVLGACPFKTLHQYQLGVLKYILGSLYNYRHIPDYFLDWISKRGNPDYPSEFDDGDTQNTTENLSEGESSDDDSSSNSESQPDRTEEEKFKDWILTRPKKEGKKVSRDVFARTTFEKAARYVNSKLERQSDRGIPGLSYRSGLTALSKMMGQELPGLCLLTIISLGGMMGKGNSNLERDFTVLLWLSISLNDILHLERYTDDCLSTLESHLEHFMKVMVALIGHQREYESSVGLRLSKFQGLLHYPRQIRKFGSPLNFFGGFLESFLKDFLKRPSKRVNGHTHCLQHDILVQSQESRQFDIARRIIFPSAYVCSFTEDDKEMAEIGLPNPPQKTPTATTATQRELLLPKSICFSVTRNPEDDTWNMDPGDFPPQVLRNTGSPYYRLYHPHLPTGKPFVDALVNSAVIRGRKIGLCVDQVNFYYHVRITSDDTHSNVILRCNPLWNSGTPLSGSGPRDWFDWVEVNWEDRHGNVYSVPASLYLWGQALYSDGSTELLATVHSLQSYETMKPHDRMFFARGDELACDTASSLSVVDFESILSTAFVVPAHPPGARQGLKNASDALTSLMKSNYYVALPPRSQWKYIGWEEPISVLT